MNSQIKHRSSGRSTAERRQVGVGAAWMHILKVLITATLLLACSCAQTAHSAADPETSNGTVTLSPAERQWLTQHDGRIRIGITMIPPQVLTGDGKYRGLAIDYIRLMERKLGCRFELVPFATWNEVIQAAKAREIDMIFAAQQTPERLTYLLFTEPYIELPNMILVRKDRQGGSSLNEMKGWIVAVSEGSAVHEYLKTEFRYLDLRPVPDELSGLMKVSMGQVDAMVIEISRASYYIEKAGILNLRVAGNAGLLYQLRFAVRNDWPVLGRILDKGLSSLTDEERRDISQRWIIVGERSTFADRRFWTSLVAGLVVLALAVMGVIIWNRTLRRIARQRTSQLQQELAERKKAEESLHRLTLLQRTILDNAAYGIISTDPDGIVSSFNRAAERQLGYSADEVVGRLSPVIWHDPQEVAQRARQLSEELGETVPPGFEVFVASSRRRNLPEEREWTFIRKDGTRVPMLLSISVLRGEDDHITGFVGLTYDLTERMRAEQERRESETRYRRIVDTAIEGICSLGPDAMITFVNARMEEMLGRSAAEMIDRPLTDFMFGEDIPDHLAKMENRRRGLSEHYERRFRHRNGEAVWTQASAAPILDDTHRFLGSFAMFTDITERKLAEEELRRLKDELEQRVAERTADLQGKSVELQENKLALMNIVEDLNEKTVELEQANAKLQELDRLKSMFIASMSHELRTPLNSIIGFSSIMLNEWTGPLTTEQKENLSAVLRSGKHLLSLINDVIDVSKIEAGKVESVIEDFDIRDVVNEAVNTFEKDIEKKGLKLNVRVIPRTMHADRRRLLQCLLNLVSNAVKYTETGTVSISAELSTNGSAMAIAVEDTGIGIRREDIKRLFLPFVRLHAPMGNTVPGTGLGLYLTQKLTKEILKGDILVSSTQGKGSTFTLRVPLAAEGRA